MSERVFFDPEFETLCLHDLRVLQENAWRTQWAYVKGSSPFYRAGIGGSSAATPTLDDLRHLPLTDKDQLRDSQQRYPPFGDYLACAEGQVVRVHRTSGTSGRALNLGSTKRDTEHIARVGARAMFAAGLRPADRVVHCLNYCIWTGGLTDHLSLEATGATVIPFGVGHTKRLLETIEELAVTAVSCTPSYPALMEKVYFETTGRSPRDLGLRLGLFGGEGGLDNPDFRRSLERTWGFKARNANYGLSEVLSQFAGQCEQSDDLHFHAGDVVFAEILEAKTGRPLPMEPGATGELVCTNLARQCQPLVRYRTGDLIEVSAVDRCDCGRTSWRFRVTGRCDDMFNVRGINVFPSAVHRVLSAHPRLTSAHFRIHLRGPGPYDRIELIVEAARDLARSQWPDAGRTLETAVRDAIGAAAAVTMTAFEFLHRTEGKTAWVERIEALNSSSSRCATRWRGSR